jgi:hypothetical protein
VVVETSFQPSPRISEAWFTDERSPTRRLHVSYHWAEAMIVLSIWLEDRCTASFRMPLRDAGRLIASVADAMGRALSPPSRQIVRVPIPRWRESLQHIPRLFWHREPPIARSSRVADIRVLRIVDDSSSAPRSE